MNGVKRRSLQQQGGAWGATRSFGCASCQGREEML